MSNIEQIIYDAWHRALSIEAAVEYAKQFGIMVTADQVENMYRHIDHHN